MDNIPHPQEDLPTLKPAQDCSKQADDAIAQQTERLSAGGNLEDAVNALLAVEKVARLAGDFHSTARVCVEIVRLVRQHGTWQRLNDTITMISKRRGQFKQAITRVVQLGVGYLNEAPTRDEKLQLIDTLRAVSEGKMYVELERARVTRLLASMREEEGRVKDAADVIQEVQVETIGSMERREKFEFVLEQMRLCLACNELIRVQLLSKKIGVRTMEDQTVQDLKVRFHELMFEMHARQDNYLDMSRAHLVIFHTPAVQDDDAKWREALRNAAVFALLAPYDAEQRDLLLRVHAEKRLRELPFYQSLLTRYASDELIHFAEVRELINAEPNCPAFSSMDKGDQYMGELKKRTVEHNVRVIAKFYTSIRLERLASIVELTVDEAEETVSRMVSVKTIFAKIDRVAGTIAFTPMQRPDRVLTEWGSKVSELLRLVENSCQLINRENMVYKIST